MDAVEGPGLLDRVDGWFRGRAWLVDTCLAVVLAALLAPASLRLVQGSDVGTTWRVVVVGAVVALHVAVALRRRAPLSTFAVVAGAELVLALAPPLTDPFGATFSAVLVPSSLGYLVVAYTVSADTERPWPALSLSVGSLGAVLSAVRFVASPSPGTLTIADLLLLLGLLMAAVVAAWALGRFRRVRIEQVAALAERARAAEADRERRDRRAAAAERARIARELHDVVAHSLSVMVRQAEAGRYVADKDPTAAATVLATVADTGREALTDMRALLGVLRADSGSGENAPQPTLEDLPELIERVRSSGQPVRFRVEGEPRAMDRAAHLAAYRLVQEALTNVVKHAGPQTGADVLLSWSAADLRIRVSDTGSSTPRRDQADTGGVGLLGMRERVQLAGGRLNFGHRGPGGFTVEAALPTTADVSRTPS